MSVLDRLEQKMTFLRYPRLMLYFIIAYAIGFVLQRLPGDLMNYLVFSPQLILQGQVWRLITFIMVPSSDQIFLALITCFVYFSISNALEQVIGRWRVNFFLVSGIVIEVLFGFLYYFVFDGLGAIFFVTSLNPYYLYAMLFVIFAMIYPDARFLFMFIIPIRGKWMVFITLAMYALDVVSAFSRGYAEYAWILVFMIAAAIVTLILFLLLSGYRPGKKTSGRSKVVRMNSYAKNSARQGASGFGRDYRHKCALCGRTDRSNPELDFRYCSKCQGAYEYCSDHLYTHIHVGSGAPGSADSHES